MISKHKYIGWMLFLYLCVMIPLMAVSILATQSSFGLAKDRENKMMVRVLQDISKELDGWQSDFQRQASVLGTRNELFSTVMESSRIKEMEAVQLLEFAQFFSSHTDEIVVYYGADELYSSEGLSRIPVYFNKTLKCVEKSAEEGKAALSEKSTSVLLLRASNGEDRLMFHFPFQKSLILKPSSIQFMVSLKHIADVLEMYSSTSQIMFCIRVNDTCVYFQVTDGRSAILTQEEFERLQEKRDSVLTQTIWNQTGELELYFDPLVSWMELRRLQYVNAGLLMLGIFLSVLLSFVLSKRRWGRFQSLADTVQLKETPDAAKKRFVDEFDYIRTLLTQSVQENQQVEKCAQDYRHGLVCQTAMMVFHGVVTRTETILQMLYSCDLELTKPFYYVCGFLLEDTEMELQEYEEIFEDYLYCEVQSRNGKAIVLLVETDTLELDYKVKEKRVNRLCDELDNFGITVKRAALSQIYNKLSMVNYAYLEVLNFLDNPLQPEKFVECWDCHSSIANSQISPQVSAKLAEYIEALEHHDLKRAEEKLKGMMEYQTENEYYLRYCIRQALILAVRSSDSEQGQTLLSQIMQINPVNDSCFTERIIKILQSFCVDDTKNRRLEIAIDYVRENYSRYDLSLEEVADCVGISKTQMSKLFKNQFGMGYLDFLTELRLHKAQELLANTNMSVKNVIQEVGYLDKTSFTKKFKAKFAMTPTEYRLQSQRSITEETELLTETEEYDL